VCRLCTLPTKGNTTISSVSNYLGTLGKLNLEFEKLVQKLLLCGSCSMRMHQLRHTHTSQYYEVDLQNHALTWSHYYRALYIYWHHWPIISHHKPVLDDSPMNLIFLPSYTHSYVQRMLWEWESKGVTFLLVSEITAAAHKLWRKHNTTAADFSWGKLRVRISWCALLFTYITTAKRTRCLVFEIQWRLFHLYFIFGNLSWKRYKRIENLDFNLLAGRE
jgi:hypothetical protein